MGSSLIIQCLRWEKWKAGSPSLVDWTKLRLLTAQWLGSDRTQRGLEGEHSQKIRLEPQCILSAPCYK